MNRIKALYRSWAIPCSGTTVYAPYEVNGHTLHFVSKKGGKVIQSGRVVVSPDGKTRTVAASGTNPQGTKFTLTAVYDKQ